MGYEKELEKEIAYVQFPGERPIDISQGGSRQTSNSVRENFVKLKELLESHKGKTYRSSHNHPKGKITPSANDMHLFMENNRERAMVTGKKGVGYFIVMKTKLTPQVTNWDLETPDQSIKGAFRTFIDITFRDDRLWKKVEKSCKPYEVIRDDPNSNPEQTLAAFDKVAKELHLKYRVLKDVKGYNLKPIEIPKQLDSLEKIAATASIIGIAGGIFFLSPSITGNVIADLSFNAVSWIGGILLIIGLVVGFFWVKSRKRLLRFRKYLEQ